jgi:hypothetical protein
MWKEEAVFRLIRLGLSRADIERVFDECGIVGIGPDLVRKVKSAESNDAIDAAIDAAGCEVFESLRQF